MAAPSAEAQERALFWIEELTRERGSEAPSPLDCGLISVFLGGFVQNNYDEP